MDLIAHPCVSVLKQGRGFFCRSFKLLPERPQINSCARLIRVLPRSRDQNDICRAVVITVSLHRLRFVCLHQSKHRTYSPLKEKLQTSPRKDIAR